MFYNVFRWSCYLDTVPCYLQLQRNLAKSLTDKDRIKEFYYNLFCKFLLSWNVNGLVRIEAAWACRTSWLRWRSCRTWLTSSVRRRPRRWPGLTSTNTSADDIYLVSTKDKICIHAGNRNCHHWIVTLRVTWLFFFQGQVPEYTAEEIHNMTVFFCLIECIRLLV